MPSVVAFMVERLGEMRREAERLLDAQRLNLLAAQRRDRDADVLHVLAALLCGHDDLVERRIAGVADSRRRQENGGAA